jgi:uncharacterized protein YbjT (DUF2867 family)
MTSIIILGATGLVGQQLLTLVLNDESISQVIAPTRRPLPAHPKLNNPIVDFNHLPENAPWWQADVVLCALGTTMRQAGSPARFYSVDHDYVLNAAKLAHRAGTSGFVLNSSTGAKLDASSFYLRVKAETERDLAALHFNSLTLVRPSLLDGGPRPEHRIGESMAICLSKLLGPLLSKRLRPVTTVKVAKAMLNAGLMASAGIHVIESEQLQEMSR